MAQHTCRWSVNMKEIRLGFKNLGSFLDDIECMLLLEPALPVEMIFKISDVRLALGFGKELFIGRDVHSRGSNLETHSHQGFPSVRL